MKHRDQLIAVCQAYKTMRNTQHVYFATVKNNKDKTKAYIDPLPKLQESRAAEKEADNLVKSIMAELDEDNKKLQQPELFGRRQD